MPRELRVIDGITVRRRQVWSAPITEQSWGWRMIQAIASCQALGVTAFEIELGPGETVPKPTSSYAALFPPTEPEPVVPPKESGPATLTVYAVVVE